MDDTQRTAIIDKMVVEHMSDTDNKLVVHSEAPIDLDVEAPTIGKEPAIESERGISITNLNETIADEELKAVGIDSEELNGLEDEELTDKEKKELRIQMVKDFHSSKSKFSREPVHYGSQTVNKYGTNFKKKRQNKNKQQKQSRKSS
jgi:hypothetical protein